MKSYRKELWFEVPSRRGFINITPTVEECLRESGIQEGLILCNAKHITVARLTLQADLEFKIHPNMVNFCFSRNQAGNGVF